MKRFTFLIVIVLMIANETEAKKIEGKVLFKNDTLDVIFKIPINIFSKEINFEKLQYKIKYIDSAKNTVVIKSNQAEEIRFLYQDEEVRMLSRYTNDRLENVFSNNYKIFLKLEIDGKIKLFKYYQTESSPVMYNSSSDLITEGISYQVDKCFLQKDSQELIRIKGLTFRKDMMEYFSDCHDVFQKIENKEYRKKDIETIVNYYNSYCINKEFMRTN
jgi:hypothetical protein